LVAAHEQRIVQGKQAKAEQEKNSEQTEERQRKDRKKDRRKKRFKRCPVSYSCVAQQ
jgi:hypothetical protein